MGRTNPTFRDVLRSVREGWRDFRRALRYEDQGYYDDLLAAADEFADAAGYLNSDEPVHSVLLSLALGQEKRRQQLEREVETLDARVEELEERLADLESGRASTNADD